MKLRILITFALAVLLLSALTGCQSGTVRNQLDKAEDYVEQKLDTAADKVEEAITPSPAATTSNHITAEEAEAIALADAGFTADRLTRIRTEYELDNGVPEYDVKFWIDDREYEYEIHAETGTILRKESESLDSTRPATEPQATDSGRLTAEEAEAIALADAGLTADQVKHLRTEFDLDNGIAEYEVDFHHDGWEYDYTIHAETGKILSRDKDLED